MTRHAPKTLMPKEAWDLLQANPKAILLDVRSHMEFLFVGHPVGAVHIPWLDEPDWVVNPNFVTEVRQLILGGVSESHDEANVPLVLICRSGKRSLEAGEVLVEAGIHNVYNVAEGFEGELDEHHHRSSLGGWRYADLPWEQC
ncbi:MAG: rhodanese-like domain-containing protein [Gammaproteobacteria bacterium]|nr:rhodanese-like domain-containing protein [Gammaproteobacteria bacterium]